MAKNSRPEIDNPLANMGLDDIVRGITTPRKIYRHKRAGICHLASQRGKETA